MLRLRDFRLLWLSQACSTLADHLVTVALALYVTDIGTPTDVGLVLAAGTVPFVALLVFGGVWADRLPRHRVMVVTDLARGALHLLLAVLILTGEPAIWQIALIEAAFGAARAFFQPAYTGLVPQTVPDELVQEAQGAIMLTENLAETLGPALAATLVVTVGAGWAFAVDAATFVVSALLLIGIRPRDRGGTPAERTALRAEIAEGWTELRRRPWVAWVIGSSSFALLVALAPFQALGPTIAEDAYDSAALYGVVTAAIGGGTIVGTLLALRWKPARPIWLGLLMTIGWCVAFLAFALGAPLAITIAVMALGGTGIALFLVWWETSMALAIPPHALSRVSSFDWMGSLGLLPVGFVLAGPIAASIGAQETLAAGAALSILVTAMALRSRSVRGFAYPKSGTPAVGVDASP